MVKMGMRQQDTVYSVKLAIKRSAPEPLPEVRCRQVIPVKSFQRRQ